MHANKFIYIIFFSLVLLNFSAVLATDSTSANFISRDPIVSDYGGRSSSTNFENLNSGGQTVIGEASSANFIWRSGFLYFDIVGPKPVLSLTVLGLPAGFPTEGLVTDASSTPESISFGNLQFGAEVEAAHRLIVNTNARGGYQIFVFARSPLTGPEDLPFVTGSNEEPVSWAIPEGAPGAFGYHAGDDVLAGGSARFAPNNSYAALASAPKEVAFSAEPGAAGTTDVVFKIQVTEEQAAGDYETGVGYIVVPIF